MTKSQLTGFVFDALSSETDNEDCVERAVSDLLVGYKKLLDNPPKRAAIRRMPPPGRRGIWLKIPEIDADPSADGIECRHSTEPTPAAIVRVDGPETVTPTPNATNVVVADSMIGIADEIMKFQKLREMGVLTDDEFDVVKKRLLGKICPSLNA
ncbi:SHOCT domain-containing protein [Stieleria mannarensis]|uniref:SHOCT domain-containing protein n=1 Tax=Stieleria mannarensis TaxID=2755585 RepID=UPI0016027083|nr:SHOCT domain-containing protein [Rhodopirellula sp. JC639]